MVSKGADTFANWYPKNIDLFYLFEILIRDSS